MGLVLGDMEVVVDVVLLLDTTPIITPLCIFRMAAHHILISIGGISRVDTTPMTDCRKHLLFIYQDQIIIAIPKLII